MPDDQKDRFGDKLRDVEKAKEDQFFAERDRRLVEKLKARPIEPAPETVPPPPSRKAGWLARILGRSR